MTKETALKQYFGYDTFRPLQAEIIENALAGKDALVIMPTGGGKSLCYQLPALVRDGMAIVISPLIALMKDQVQALQANGIAAEFLNSSQPFEEQRSIEQDCSDGKVKILYVSPERLFVGNQMNFLKQLNINLFAIDEAHCISFWGHDFRPEYMQLKAIKVEFPHVPILALTATADVATRQDISKQLGIDESNTFMSSFDRPNLSLTVLPGRRRLDTIREFLEEHKNQTGIIYCLSRKTTEYIAQSLTEIGFKAKHYHAGMDSVYRNQVQDAFIKDDIQIMVATIAFGMGIDKSNIRWVLHYNMPRNVESFYQEIGRAGRDGLPADTVILYSYADVIAQMRFNEELPQDRRDLLNSKLERMRQYSESDMCRRRVLLSYFNEPTETDCGNCDVCLNPREKFDATIIAQKALSCVARATENIAQGMLIDILKGSSKKEIQQKGYDRLKTYGVGRDLSQEEWTDYIAQLINLGFADVAYNDHYTVKLNAKSWEVLKNNKPVELAKHVPVAKKRAEQAETEVSKPKHEVIQDELFERLKELRKKIADRESIPPHNLFGDTTLWEMARYKPVRDNELAQIIGVTEEKVRKYSHEFTEFILAFIREKKTQVASLDIDTHKLSLNLYQTGLTPQQIAEKRGLKADTIIGHLLKLHHEEGADIDFWQIINRNEYEMIIDGVVSLDLKKGDALKPLYEYLNEAYDYYKLRIALTLWEKEEAQKGKEKEDTAKVKINIY